MIEAPDIAKQGNGQASPPLPRKRGRPKGLPKTGGRKKGTKNWTNSEIRDELLSRSGAIDVLADIVAGRQLYAGSAGSVGKAGWRYPTLQQRLQALQILLAKVIPDLKATELSGPEGEPLIPDPPCAVDKRQLARAILSILSDANMVDSVPHIPDNETIGNSDPPASPPAAAFDGEASDALPEVDGGGPSETRSDEKEGSENIGERILVGSRGAEIVAVETEIGARKFAVYDGYGELHSFRRSRVVAEALALTLNGPSLDMKPGPENGGER